MRSFQTILDLVNSASEVATKIVLKRFEKRITSETDWVPYQRFSLWSVGSPLTIERKGPDVRVSKDNTAILQRYQRPEAEGLLSYFMDPKPWITELAGLNLDDVSEDTVAGRTVLVVPLSNVILSIDAEFGMILTAENDIEKIHAISVELLEKWRSSHYPEPHFPAAVLPPASTGNRNLRVLCPEFSIPSVNVGDQVLLFLTFDQNLPPVDQLETTRRGYTDPIQLDYDHRQYRFHADGWDAIISTVEPLHDEEELTGYFLHRLDPDSAYPTIAVVTAAHYHGTDAIIDVTLDGVHPPKNQETLEGISTSTSDGDIFWLSDESLPFVRGFSVSTGELSHEISIPTFQEIVLDSANRARVKQKQWPHDFSDCKGKTWELPDLKEVFEAVPSIPAGWRLLDSFGKNLHNVTRENPRLNDNFWLQTILRLKPFKAVDLDIGRSIITAIYPYGDRIYLRASNHHITFNQDLEILNVEVFGDPEVPESGLVYLPPGDSPTLGFPTGTLMMFHKQERTYAFHDPETTEQLTTVNLDRNSFSVAYSSRTKIVVALKNPESHFIDKLLVWEPQTGWREQNLER